MYASTLQRTTATSILIVFLGVLSLPTSTHAIFGVGDAVIVIDDSSLTNIETMLQSTLSTVEESLQTGFQSALNIKELSLDGIAYGLARTAIQAMVQSTVTWINSGFEGSPAFVTDLNGFMTDLADQVVGEAIYGSDLAFLCSPFALDIKIALATQYSSGSQAPTAQCTLSEVTDNIEGFINGSFSEGGWPAWFELTQGSANDPTKAYFEATLAIDANIVNAQGEAITELGWADGFLSFKVCKDTQVQSGTETDCDITTPGTVIANQLNTALGAGTDALITADEVNEVIGALLGQLAQQALTGAYGLLGLGGSSSYTDYSYGTTADASYIDALATEPTAVGSTPGSLSGTAITGTIVQEEAYLAVQQEISARISAVRSSYNTTRTSYPRCSLPSFPSDFTRWQSEAQAAIARSTSLLPVLREINTRFTSSTSAAGQAVIINEFLQLQSQLVFKTASDVGRANVTLELEIVPDIATFQSSVSESANRCRSSDDDDN